MTKLPILTDKDGQLHYGQPTACRHCGTMSREHVMTMPRSGVTYVAHIPLDTCCAARAREIHDANRLWAARYRNLGHQTSGDSRQAYLEEAGELEARNRAISATMRARQGAA